MRLTKNQNFGSCSQFSKKLEKNVLMDFDFIAKSYQFRRNQIMFISAEYNLHVTCQQPYYIIRYIEVIYH